MCDRTLFVRFGGTGGVGFFLDRLWERFPPGGVPRSIVAAFDRIREGDCLAELSCGSVDDS